MTRPRQEFNKTETAPIDDKKFTVIAETNKTDGALNNMMNMFKRLYLYDAIFIVASGSKYLYMMNCKTVIDEVTLIIINRYNVYND